MYNIIKYPRSLRDLSLLLCAIFFLCILGGIVAVSTSPKVALFFGAFILLSCLIPPLLGKLHIFLLVFIALIPLGMVITLLEGLSIMPLLGLLAFGLWFIKTCTKQDPLIIVPEFKWFFALIVVMFISSWFGTNMRYSLYVAKTYLQLFILFFLIIQAFREPKQLFLIGWVLIVSLSILAFSIIVDHLQFINIHGGFESIDYNRLHERAEDLSRDPNQTALYLSIAIPFTLYYIIIYKDFYKLIFLLTCLMALTYGIILTHSMGGIVGLISIAFLFILLHKNIGIEKKVFFFISLVPILFAGYIFSPPTLKLRVQDKIEVIQNEDFSKWGSSRGGIWLASLEVIKENPVLGVGLGNSGREIAWLRFHNRAASQAAHNLFLPIAIETGIIGLSIFIALICSTLKSLLAKLKSSSTIMDKNFSYLGSAIYLSFASLLVQAMFLNMERNKYLWLLLGLAATFTNIANNIYQTNKEQE